MRKIISAVMCIAVLMTLLLSFTASAVEIVYSGDCGAGVRWTLDSTGTLTVSGEGAITDYEFGKAPWYAYGEKITNVIIGDGITRIGNCTFGTQYGYSNNYKNLYSVKFGESVESIGGSAFMSTVNLIEIKLPDSIKHIEFQAFRGSGILSINLPESVLTVGENAFLNSKLQRVEIPGSVKLIGKAAFKQCYDLQSAKISSGIEEIGEEAFSNCNKLLNIELPNTLKTIRKSAFYGCSSLAKISIPESVTSIAESAFSSSGLANIVLPSSITTLTKSMFEGCKNLTRITLPVNLLSIAERAFYGSGLVEINLPEGLMGIGASAFENCKSLGKITLPTTMNVISDQAFRNSGLAEINLHSNIASIGKQSFEGCTSLEKMTLPEGVMSVGEAAFNNSGIKTVYIPKSLMVISKNTFNNCKNLAEVKYSGSESDWNNITVAEGNDYLKNVDITYGVAIDLPSITPDIPVTPGTGKVVLTYNANGGVEPPSPVTVNAGEKVTVTTEKLSRTGFEFLGWAKTPSSKSPEYRGGEKITLKQNTTLYAVWNDPNAKYNTVIVLTIDKTEATVNGETVYNDVAPIIENSRTMLPARFVAEKLGATVAWNDAERKVTITGADGTKIEIIVDSTTAYVNGTAHTLDSPAFIRNSRTYTPVRFICDNLGANILWDNDTRTVTITK